MSEREWQTRVAAILTVAGLDAYALHLGHNGILLATSIAIIAGIAGYSAGRDHIRKSVRVAEAVTDAANTGNEREKP